MVYVEKVYDLGLSACDEISGVISDFCAKQDVDRKDMIRYRLSAEDYLLNWINKGCEGRKVRLIAGKRFFAPYIMIEMDGSPVNPETEDSKDYGEYCDLILLNLNLKPVYSYTDNRNCLYYRMKKRSVGQFQILIGVVILSILVGFLGLTFIPDDIRKGILDVLIEPIYNTFFNILGCIAGPMIFLSVAWGIYGIGDVETLGRIGRSMMLSFLKYVTLAAASCVIFFPVLGNRFTGSSSQGSQIKAILEMILSIFPSNIVDPFQTGNTLQIIFLAVVIGIALLFMQRQTRAVAIAIGQVNALVNFLMGLIGRLVPFVVFMVVVNLIWAGNLSVVTSVWKFTAVYLLALLMIASAYLFFTSRKQKVKPTLLINKSLPTFLVALTSASSAAAFGNNVATCEKEYGIDPSLVSFGIPLGIVMHKPMTAAYNLVLVMYFAGVYHVKCTPAWLILAVFICVVVAVAASPIPGGGSVVYTILFLQLGIPTEALAVALTLDIIADFLLTAFDMFALQMALINISSKMGRINHKILRS